MTDIPGLAFLPDGAYDLSSPEKRLAACEATLRAIEIVPIAYHARGAEFCRAEMARIAGELATALQRERAPVTATTIALAQIDRLYYSEPHVTQVTEACLAAASLDLTADQKRSALEICAAAYNDRFGARS